MKSSLLALAFLTLTSALIAQDGVVFDAVPIAINSACNPVIFKGTKRTDYAGTAFLMPRIQLAKTSRGSDAIEFVKLSNGKYILQLGLYFPRFAIGNNQIHYEKYSQAECNYNQIKAAINRSINNPQDEIKHIVTLQIKNIGVEVDGVEDSTGIKKTFKVAKDSTSILQYLGQTKMISIPLESIDQKNDIITRLTVGQGLNININFEFQARKVNGFCNFKIDTNKLANEVGTIINGKMNTKVTDKIPSNELQAALGAAIKNVSTSMTGSSYCEEGDNPEFQKAASDMLKRITTQMQRDLSDYRPSQLDPYGLGGGSGFGGGNDWSDQPLPGDDDGLGALAGNGGSLLDDPLDDGLGGNGQGGDGALPEIPRGTKIKDRGVGLKAFVQNLKKQKNYSFTMTSMGKTQVKIYSTSLILSKDEDEPGRSKLSLSSESKSVSTRIKLNKDDELRIYPLREVSRKLSYQKATTYYSMSALDISAQFNHFPILDSIITPDADNKDTKISKLTERKTTSGTIGYYTVRHPFNWNKLVMLYSPIPSQLPFRSITQFNWGEINYEQLNSKPKEVSYDTTSGANDDDEFLTKAQVLSNFDVGFTFNKRSPGRVYSLKKLFSLNESEKAFAHISYDDESGAVVLKAKKDLGVLRLVNRNKTVTVNMKPKQHFQDTRTRDGEIFPGKNPFKKVKAVRTLSKHDQSTDMPVLINEQVFKLEKVGVSIDMDSDSFEIPTTLFDESGKAELPIETKK